MSVEAVSGCTDYSLADPLVFDVDGVQDVIALRGAASQPLAYRSRILRLVFREWVRRVSLAL